VLDEKFVGLFSGNLVAGKGVPRVSYAPTNRGLTDQINVRLLNEAFPFLDNG
jgi:hypothetical protein